MKFEISLEQVCGMYYTCVEMMRAGLGGKVWLAEKATYSQVACRCEEMIHRMTPDADCIIADLMND